MLRINNDSYLTKNYTIMRKFITSFLLLQVSFIIIFSSSIKAQQNRSDLGVLNTIAPNQLFGEVFRFKPGLVTLPSTGTLNLVGANDKWLSFGNDMSGSPFIGTNTIGTRYQQNYNSLFMGLNANTAVIEYGSYINSATSPQRAPNLEFKSFVSNGGTGYVPFTPLIISGGTTTNPKDFATYANGRYIGQLQDGDYGDVLTGLSQWSSIGNYNAVGRNLYGLRIQRANRAVTLGFDAPTSSGSSPTEGLPFLEWIGNSTNNVTPEKFKFKYAYNPTGGTSLTARADAFTLEPNATMPSVDAGGYAYSNKGMVGDVSVGSFGNLGLNNKWIGSGLTHKMIGNTSILGTRIQDNGLGLLLNVRNDAGGIKRAFIEYGGNSAITGVPTLADFDLHFRTYFADNDLNITPSTMVLKQDGNVLMSSIASGSFYNPKVEINTLNIVNGTGEVDQLGLAINTRNYDAI